MDFPQVVAADAGRNWRQTGKRRVLTPKDLLRSRFVRFLLVGGINTLFGYGVFAALILLRVPYALAALVSTVAGILFNFKSYGTLVFGSRDNRLIFRFFAVYGVCYLLGLVPLAWAKAHHMNLLVVAAVMLVPMAAVSFVLNRTFVFGARR
jgi:putative flippase GtrA